MNYKMEKTISYKQEFKLPSDISHEDGQIIFYRPNSYMGVMYIDIKSRRIPVFHIGTEEEMALPYMTINYSFCGKCEFLLKNGAATYLDTGEYAIDYGTALPDNESYYYPRAEYKGLELFLFPCPQLDLALSLHGMENTLSTALGTRFQKLQEPFISKASPQFQRAIESMLDDVLLSPTPDLLLLDSSRFLQLLEKESSGDVPPRVYYSSSQVQIARKAMDILTDDLSKRHSAAWLASSFGISETCLKNYFRGVYGRGYSELLNEIRMKKAAELILENKMKIAQISDAVGFATQSRFARAFKNYYGMAPLEFKRTANLKPPKTGPPEIFFKDPQNHNL